MLNKAVKIVHNKYEGRGDSGTMIVMKNEAKIALQAVPRKGSLVMLHRQWCERDMHTVHVH